MVNPLFAVKRIYEKPEASDGRRILVDRLWPRGMTKERACLDRWAKELAPSHELRRSYDHSREMWPQFRENYFLELGEKDEPVREILKMAAHGPVTLLYGCRDEKYNNAVALMAYLEGKMREDKVKI